MRNILANTFKDPVPILFSGTVSSQSEALVALVKCTPFNLNSTVNLLVVAEFNLPTSFEENEYYVDFRNFCLDVGSRFFPPSSIPYEYFHWPVNWRIKILSDHIALSISKSVTCPVDLKTQSSYALFQIQERTSLYGGILRKPNVFYKLPDNFYMTLWTFYECSPDVFEEATKHQKNTKKLTKSSYLHLLCSKAIHREERTRQRLKSYRKVTDDY